MCKFSKWKKKDPPEKEINGIIRCEKSINATCKIYRSRVHLMFPGFKIEGLLHSAL